MSKIFEDIKAGLEEAIEYRKGKIKLRSSTYMILKKPKNLHICKQAHFVTKTK